MGREWSEPHDDMLIPSTTMRIASLGMVAFRLQTWREIWIVEAMWYAGAACSGWDWVFSIILVVLLVWGGAEARGKGVKGG